MRKKFIILNGKLKRVSEYLKWKQEGVEQVYDEEGNILYKMTYHDGIENGPFKIYEQGMLAREGQYRNGEYDGVIRYYGYKNGKKVTSSQKKYHEGELVIDENIKNTKSLAKLRYTPEDVKKSLAKSKPDEIVRIKINSKEITAAFSNLDILFSQVRMIPYLLENHQIVGVKFLILKQESPFAKMGLQEGDIILSMNGIAFTLEKGIPFLQNIQNQNPTNFRVHRKKKLLELRILED
ncbi:MAG: hypothetical protein HYU97_02425 [Deltaproteobacteria bacterium]|nr:hypothetical protein [Deltaproteobacteria bacterium]